VLSAEGVNYLSSRGKVQGNVYNWITSGGEQHCLQELPVPKGFGTDHGFFRQVNCPPKPARLLGQRRQHFLRILRWTRTECWRRDDDWTLLTGLILLLLPLHFTRKAMPPRRHFTAPELDLLIGSNHIYRSDCDHCTSRLAHGIWDQVDIEKRQESLQEIVGAREALWLSKSIDGMFQQSCYREGRRTNTCQQHCGIFAFYLTSRALFLPLRPHSIVHVCLLSACLKGWQIGEGCVFPVGVLISSENVDVMWNLVKLYLHAR